jgi:adenylate cyclase
MPDLVAQGAKPEQRWRKTLSAATVILGRTERCDWEAPWDETISRRHASLTWKDNKLHVVRLAESKNPIYVGGKEVTTFTIGAGEFFTIGTTRFSVEDTEASISLTDEKQPLDELTCSVGELLEVKYGANAADRLEALARLPALMRFMPSDDAFERSVLDILLAGIPGAAGAALIWINPSGASSPTAVRVHASAGRGGLPASVQPSRRLAREAIRVRRQPVMHSWAGVPGDDQMEYTINTQYECAICAPLADDPGWALYVVGCPVGGGRKEDLKYAGLVADIFGQLRQVRDLQKRRRVFEGFMSPKVVAFLANLRNQKVDEILKPSTCNITVLFCDLRGFSRLSEQDDDLQALCDRVSKALRIMTRNIIQAGGVIGDFHGDAAMGFWGWPDQTEDQVERAAGAALAILREFKQANQIPKDSLAQFACGIGIAHGPGIAGRLGTVDQFKVSVFGPVVNLAARLESMTRYFGVPILVDEVVAEGLSAMDASRMRVRRIARVQPFGMERTTMVHELLPAGHEEGTLPDTAQADYEAALENFLTGRWHLTRTLIENWIATDPPSQMLLNYINTHDLPPRPWSGIMVMDKK